MGFRVQCLPIELPWKQPHSSCVLYNRASAAHQTWVAVAEVTGHTNIWSFTEKVCWPLDLSMFRALFSWEFHINTVFPSFPSFQLHLSPLTSITSLIISVLLFYTHTHFIWSLLSIAHMYMNDHLESDNLPRGSSLKEHWFSTAVVWLVACRLSCRRGSWSVQFFYYYSLVTCMATLSAFMFSTCVTGAREGREEHRIPWNWHSRRLWTVKWMLGVEFRSSGRAVGALHHWATAPAP